VIAKVEPLTTARALRGPFDYRLPADMADVEVGAMLVVPFGRRRVLGVVTEVAERSELAPERLVEPISALEEGVSAELVRLGLWVASEYCSTPARGLALVLPPGTGLGQGPRTRPRSTLRATLTEAGRAALAGAGRLGSRQRAALERLQNGPSPAAELGRAAGCDHSTLRRLQARGLIELELERVERRPRIGRVGAGAERAAPALVGAQAAALETIVTRLGAGARQRSVLLHGVTGSGKTEVYLQAAAAALERGRSAIVLVPEIALTPQTAGRFEARFGPTVAVLHSQLSSGERYDEWLRMRSGEARVCVGPRSAVFAPLTDLGLIVIDEEHEASYKQESDPRYDARAVAARRAREADAVLVAGSATPRPESFAARERLVLPERVDGRGLPSVEVVGTAGMAGPLHARTWAALREVADRREKAIVLLNRRGWSAFLTCRGCARVWGCPRCDVSLVLHRSADRLSCHHCGYAERVPEACPDCGSVSVARHGAGTERVEEALSEALAPLEVIRLDADTAARAGGVTGVLERFEAAPSGILIGTQMVAKGHDFTDVTLAVVIDADSTLRFPDFRAEERTFALVSQLAGRSGRGERGGHVIVQALDPGARVLAHAAAHDAEGFLADELERREALAYPPFAHLIRVVCASDRAGPELAAAYAVRQSVVEGLEGAGQVLGPAPLFKLKGRERAQVVVKATERAAGVRAVRGAVEARAADRSHHGVRFSVDVDPQ